MTRAVSIKRCILIIEDDYFIAQEMCRAFEATGADILGPTGRLEDALALIARADRIDGAVLDVNLRDVMVFPAADELRARNVPIVFTTGYERSMIPPHYADVPCCEKPVEPRKVIDMLFGKG